MPLEIRELVIKTSLDGGGQVPSTNQVGATRSNDVQERTAIIAECVDQVLAILKEKAER